MAISSQLKQAAERLRQGQLVAFPTETVYGLGADAMNATAVGKIFAAKERPVDHPLIVHIAGVEQLSQWALDIPLGAHKLAAAFWPGPLTMIFKKQPSVLSAVTGGQETVGVRVPRHPIAQALLRAFGGGVAAPSANRFTRLSPTSAADVAEELGDKVSVILDGGDCEVGLESTIVDMSRETPVILRPGMISADVIAHVLGMPVRVHSHDQNEALRVPGMHQVHYAPITKTRLIATSDIPELLLASGQLSSSPSIALLVHSELPSSPCIHLIPMPRTPAQYAHDLYHTLRLLDHQQFTQIVIEEVPFGCEWDAIRDRLKKASGGANK